MKSKKGKWDGKSRIVNDLYRKNFDMIFGKKEEDELKESYKQSLVNKKERIKQIDKIFHSKIKIPEEKSSGSYNGSSFKNKNNFNAVKNSCIPASRLHGAALLEERLNRKQQST